MANETQQLIVFEREVLFSGKVIFKHVENGKKRVALIEDCRGGKITPEEMRRQGEGFAVPVSREKTSRTVRPTRPLLWIQP